MTTQTNQHEQPPRATPGTGVPQTEAHREDEQEQMIHEIERVSPEGRPAHPEYRARDVGLLLIGAVAAVIVASIIVTLTAGLGPGAVVLAFGLGLAVLMNPEVWASSLRAKERSDIEHHRKPDTSRRDARQATDD